MLTTLVNFVLVALVAGAIVGLLLYAVSISPIPEPFKGWLHFAVILLAIFVIIYLLLGLVGGGGASFPKLHFGTFPATGHTHIAWTPTHLSAL